MISIQNTQLVVVDIQGKLSQIVYDSDNMLRHSRILIEGCRILDIPIVWLEQLPDKLGDTHPLIAEALNGLSPIAKSSFSALGNNKFVEHIERNCRKQIILSGIETHICVYQTAVDFIAKGYEVFVAADTVSSRSEENRHIGIEAMRQEGVKILSTEAILFALMKGADHLKFRDIAKLVK